MKWRWIVDETLLRLKSIWWMAETPNDRKILAFLYLNKDSRLRISVKNLDTGDSIEYVSSVANEKTSSICTEPQENPNEK